MTQDAPPRPRAPAGGCFGPLYQRTVGGGLRRPIPVSIPPEPQAGYVDKDGRPTQALFDYLKKLQKWAESAQAALRQLEF